MTSPAIARWILLRTLRSPLGWGLLALGILAWPTLLRFTWVGISTSPADAAALAYEFAFLGALLGAIRGLVAIEPLAPLLRLTGAGGRLRVEATALAVSALVWALVPLAWPLATGAVGEGREALLLGALLAALHLAALCLVLLRLRVPSGARSLALVLLAWVAPALLDPGSMLGRVLSPLLDAAGTVGPPTEGWGPAALAARLGPMMALALAAAWIDGRRETTRTAAPARTVPHEVRHPR